MLWLFVLLLAARSQHEDGLIDEVNSLLVQGDSETAQRILQKLSRSPWADQQADGGLELVRALSGAQTAAQHAQGDAEPPDFSRYAVPLMIRTAFERGDFQAVHRLSELAKQRDLGFVQLVSAAARIEAGEPALSVASDFDPNLSGTLSRRLAHHLATPEEQGGVLLRDRFGQPIGTTDGEALHLDEDIRYELVPRAVVDAVANHRTVGSLRLTLDLELSEAAFEAFGRYRGSIVLVDPHTGHVLAAVSDRRTWRRGGTPAFEQMREPASIAKLITTTATLRAGLQPDLELGRMRCRGHERYAGKFLYCPTIVGRLRGLDRALATSCNVAFANLGVRVGRQAMLKELGRYGFGPSSNPLAGGRILQSWGDDRQLADLSIGLEATAVTPLHAALIAAVMAANGVMPEPTLLAAEDGRLGLHPRLLPPAPGRQVIEPHWVPEMVDAMRAVVRRGTAQRVWPPSSFPVAMKTGTASDPRYGFHVNYIGIGPMPEARLAFCVRVTNQPTSAKVRYAAQQVTHRLLRNLGAIAERRGWADEAPYDELELYQRLDRLASRDLSQPATQSGLERAKRLAARR